jgi:hypothetical protein
VIVYLPAAKLIATGDETVEFYTAWPITDMEKMHDAQARTLALLTSGAVDLFVDGHHHSYDGVTGTELLQDLVASFVRFDHAIHGLLADASDGLTLEQLYEALQADAETGPDFAGAPLFMKMVILMKLRELGAVASDAGSYETRFSLP